MAAILKEFFVLSDDGWHQKRCDAEIEAANAQAVVNKRIAEEREARRKARIVNEAPQGKTHESFTDTSVEREPSQTPDSRLQTPDAISQTPDSRKKTVRKLLAGSLSAEPDGSAAPKSRAVWQAYSEAYADRYGQPPIRNATVNGILAQVVGRLGAEAPDVARFYVAHNSRYYVGASHPVSALLKDAEGLRTQWANGRQTTQTQAIQADKTQSNFNAFAPLLAEAERLNHAQP